MRYYAVIDSNVLVSAYLGDTTSGKTVTERSAMQRLTCQFIVAQEKQRASIRQQRFFDRQKRNPQQNRTALLRVFAAMRRLPASSR